jgi:hypothetical protein
MEVFSISGALGAAACPTGWQVTPNGNCGAPVAACPANMRLGNACRSQAAVALQNALVAMGNQIGDAVLKALVVDGFVGPKTTAAANRALTTHIGPGQAAADLRTGTLAIGDVAARAPQITQLVVAETARRGGSTPAPRTFTANVPVTPREAADPIVAAQGAPPRALWALVGLNALAAVTGAWGLYRGSGAEPVSYRARRARYA